MSNSSPLSVRLTEALLSQQPFVAFHSPGAQEVVLLPPEAIQLQSLHSLSEIGGKEGFLFAPFVPDSSHPLWLLHPQKNLERYPLPNLTIDTLLSSRSTTIPTEVYQKAFERFIQGIRQEGMQKLVLSRHQVVATPLGFSPLTLFFSLCQQLPQSYSYLSYIPESGLWIGSTPELLLAQEEDLWHTVALAATQPYQEGAPLPKHWSPSLQQEHQYVADYIREVLKDLGIIAQEKGPYPTAAGVVAHLKSDFYFSLTTRETIGTLVAKLHPTPAICGVPMPQARSFIQQYEGYTRGYYSGIVGWLSPQQEMALYINLRCLQASAQKLTLYAGGGLLSTSDCYQEWLETERKMQTLLQFIPLD